MRIIIIIVIVMMANVVEAKHFQYERVYQDAWCSARGYQTEVRMTDGTRCDAISATHAIEFDFAAKRYEAVGQALHYSRLTGLKAGIVLIVEKDKDMKYVEGMKLDIEHFNLNITVWIIDAIK